MPYCNDCGKAGSRADFGRQTGTGYRCPACGSYDVGY